MLPNWPLRVAAEYLVIAACILAAAGSPWLFVPAAWLAGIRLHALAIIGHWASHGVAPRRLEVFCFAPIGVDAVKYRSFHGVHHYAVGQEIDPEAQIVGRFSKRWASVRRHDSLLDLLGLHLDEGIAIMRHVASPKSLALALAVNIAALAMFGVAALALPVGLGTGFIFAHRLRARTEHDHIHQPGKTFVQRVAPAWWKRAIYLPHYTWLHAQHHYAPVDSVHSLSYLKMENP